MEYLVCVGSVDPLLHVKTVGRRVHVQRASLLAITSDTQLMETGDCVLGPRRKLRNDHIIVINIELASREQTFSKPVDVVPDGCCVNHLA